MAIMKVKSEPRPISVPGCCFNNVKYEVAEHGGEAITGWELIHHELYDQRVPHVVWRKPSGDVVDVTPVVIGEEGGGMQVSWNPEILFEPDTSVSFGNVQTAPKWIATKDDERVRRACEFMNQADEKSLAGDNQGANYLIEKAEKLLKKIDERIVLGRNNPVQRILTPEENEENYKRMREEIRRQGGTIY